jgi:predicted dithiol-disulfide oxidoreductase (DUF899 family)
MNNRSIALIDLFEQRPQLIVYHNMLNAGSDCICPGCSYYSDHVANLDHLDARRTMGRLPEGWPQEPAHSWLRLHDEYDTPT